MQARIYHYGTRIALDFVENQNRSGFGGKPLLEFLYKFGGWYFLNQV